MTNAHRVVSTIAALLLAWWMPCTLQPAAFAAPQDEPAAEPAEEPTAEPMGQPADEPAEPGGAPADGAADTGGDAAAPAEMPGVEGLDPEQSGAQGRYLDLAMHYVLIGKPDLALSSIRALNDTGITDAQLALLIDERGFREKFERCVSRGRNMQGVGEEVSQLEMRWIAGQRAIARDTARIERAVGMLGGTMRQQMIAKGQLAAAGEYAVPALLRAMSDTQNPQAAASARSMLVELKRLAVVPLGSALPSLDPAGQRRVCEVLSEIGWPTAEPYLLRLANSPSAPADVRDAAMRAYRRLGGTSNDVASQFAALAKRYFERTPTLIPYPADAANNIWTYEAYSGLSPQSVPTPVYADVMGMLLAREALRIDPSSRSALATYVACDLRRSLTESSGGGSGVEEPVMAGDASEGGQPGGGEADEPAGVEGTESAGDPSGGDAGGMDGGDAGGDDASSGDADAVGDGAPAAAGTAVAGLTPYSAAFFATAAGPSILQDVIGMALDTQDTALARAAMQSLARTASTRGLVADGGRNPLVEALTYPDRRVRFDAALVIARALPQSAFTSDSAVVPILGSMVAAGGATGASIASDDEDRRTLDARLGGIGYRPLRGGRDFSALSTELVGGQGVDVIVVQGARGYVRDAVAAVRNSRVAAATPVVVIAAPEDASGISIEFDGDPRVSVLHSGAPDDAFVRAVASAAGGASGAAVSPEEGSQYTAAALDALELIAKSGSPVLDIRNAEAPLLAALREGGELRMRVADVIALVPTDRAQRALMDAALAAQGDDQAQLLMCVATSARRVGNLLESQQVDALRKIITDSAGASSDAAGTAYGALGLPVRDVVRLIVTE